MSIITSQHKEGTSVTKGNKNSAFKELKTEGPISEKDEVKKAEDQTNKDKKKPG